MLHKHLPMHHTIIVGDMTNIVDVEDNGFDLVLDKGALDALMSEDTIEVRRKAESMYSEVFRVLTQGGIYMCISLLEQFIAGD